MPRMRLFCHRTEWEYFAVPSQCGPTAAAARWIELLQWEINADGNRCMTNSLFPVCASKASGKSRTCLVKLINQLLKTGIQVKIHTAAAAVASVRCLMRQNMQFCFD